MCRSSNEPGGPKRCSAHARDALYTAEVYLEASKVAQQHHLKQDEDLFHKQEALLASSGAAPGEIMMAQLTGEYDGLSGLSTADRDRLNDLTKERHEVATQIGRDDAICKRREEQVAEATANYHATPEGLGVLAASIDRKALAYSRTDDLDQRQQLKSEIDSTVRALAQSEQRMWNEKGRRDAVWSSSEPPPPRGARLGIEGGEQTARFVVDNNVTGAFTYTFRPDPDAQEFDGDNYAGIGQLQESQLTLTRKTKDGKYHRLRVPMEQPVVEGETRAPTVVSAIRRAHDVASCYHPDYETWAKAAVVETKPGPWRGSRSYKEAHSAWIRAGQIKEQYEKFTNRAEREQLARDPYFADA